MKARLVKFGEIEVEEKHYTHDVVIRPDSSLATVILAVVLPHSGGDPTLTPMSAEKHQAINSSP